MRVARPLCPLRASRALGASVFILVMLAAGCGETTSGTPDLAGERPDGGKCVPGATQACLCLGGAQGQQTCRASGAGFAPCAGCSANESDLELPTAVDLGASTCGDCEGCCDGRTCIPFASQVAGGLCGLRGASCALCTGGKVCATGSGTCVDGSAGCGSCAGGCCQDNLCLQNTGTACGPSCAKCTYGVTCAGGSCTMELDPAAQLKIHVKSIELTPKDPSGDSWDLIGAGEADPQVCIAFAQGGVFIEGCTGYCDDALTCVFDDTNGLITNAAGLPVLFPGTILAQGKLRLSGYDVDLSFKDLAGQAYFPATNGYEPQYQTGAFGNVVNLVFDLR